MKLLVDVALQADRVDPFNVARTRPEGNPIQDVDDRPVVTRPRCRSGERQPRRQHGYRDEGFHVVSLDPSG